LGAAPQTDILPLPFWKYTVAEQNQDYTGALTPENSTGSGITYWPNQASFLVLDNTSPGRILEYTRAGVYVRTLTLSGFGDPEDIHWMTANTFVIASEKNSGSLNELIVVPLPTGNSDATVLIASATRRLQMDGTFTSTDNLGIEGVALVGTDFYFTTEKAPSSPSIEWNVWRVANPTSGTVIQSVTPIRAFRLTGVTAGRATDISGMATDGSCLYLISHEGVNYGSDSARISPSRLVKTTLDGRFIEDSVLPSFSNGAMWRQAEGIELFVDTDGKRKIVLSGEVGAGTGGTGVQYMLLSPP
jgi:uncharacterized protein YjiK